MFIDTSYLPKDWHRGMVIIAIGLLFTCCIAAGAADTSLSGTGIAGNGTASITTAYASGSLPSAMDFIPIQRFTQQQIAKKNFLYNAEIVYTGTRFFTILKVGTFSVISTISRKRGTRIISTTAGYGHAPPHSKRIMMCKTE